jgi:hypothetical protein
LPKACASKGVGDASESFKSRVRARRARTSLLRCMSPLLAHSGTELMRRRARSWRKLTLHPWRICWSTAEAACAQVPRAGFSFGHPRL